MDSERNSYNFQEEETMKLKPLCGWEEVKAEPGTGSGSGSGSRGRGMMRRSNGKGPKRVPQRGLGVERLEKLRMQESLKKAAEASGIPTLHDHHHHHLLQYHPPQVFASGSLPVRYGAPAPSPSNGLLCQCPPQQVINDNNNTIFAGGCGFGPNFIGNKNGLNMNVLGGACSSTVAAGWIVPNNQQQHNRVVSPFGSGSLVRNPFETSKELSSMPNLHSESFDLYLKRSDRPLELWSNNVHDFFEFVPQPAVSAYANPNLDEGVEVVAVHRRGNSVSGRVFMEYEFFPGKDGRGTTSKELEFPTIASSVAVGGGSEASSSITVITPYGDATTASNSIDLSLKL